jgi:hypothetical protein
VARRFRQLIGDRRCSSTPSWSRERPHSRGRERTHAKDEFLSAAATQNLRKLAKLIPLPRPYSPHEAESLGVPANKCRPRQSPPQAARVFQRRVMGVGAFPRRPRGSDYLLASISRWIRRSQPLKKSTCSTNDPTIPLIEFDGSARGGDSFILNKSARS